MKVICIGLNHAGIAAVKTLRQVAPNATIVGYEQDADLAFLSCGIALWIKGAVKNSQDLMQTTLADLTKDGIHALVNHKVLAIQKATKKIKVQNLLTKEIFWDNYDKLILSVGSRPCKPPIEGVDLPGVFIAKSFLEGASLIKYLQQHTVKRVAVVGTGYVGVEFAEAFFEQKKEMLMFDLAPRVMVNYFEPEFTQLVEKAIQQRNIKLFLQERICKLVPEGQRIKMVTDRSEYVVDMVVFCVGAKPATDLVKGSLDLCSRDFIKTNQFFQTSDPDIYACGDCINFWDNSCQQIRDIGLATNAIRSGLVVAQNIANNNNSPFLGVQGTSAVNVFGWKLLSTGLNTQTAQCLKVPFQTVLFEDYSKPVFMPSLKVQIKLFWNTQNRKIVGCQIASQEDHSEAIYFFSLAILKGLTIDELPMVDLFFLPHFNKPDNFITQVGLRALGIKLEGV